MWLRNPRCSGTGFVAGLFELPPQFSGVDVGDERAVAPDAVTDWMVNVDGVSHGGFSIRYQRERLPQNERPAYDEHLGVTRYAQRKTNTVATATRHAA